MGEAHAHGQWMTTGVPSASVCARPGSYVYTLDAYDGAGRHVAHKTANLFIG
jgi:hypothetical protein